MNRTKIANLAIILLTISFAGINAQNLKMPREFIKAVDNGTRTLDGVPGTNYWTNSANYKLSVDVDFKNDTTWITGSADITYFNNSPDQLNMIVLRSYPDFFAGAALRNFYIFPANETDQVEYSDMIINSDTIPSQQVMTSRTSTNLIARLSNPIAAGEKARITVSWKYFMHPRINIRQGVYDDNSIFVSYWYPQVAVYDDVYGWDLTDYMGSVEFYNGFNNYEVDINVPAGYLVWAGGVLQNPDEVYPKHIAGNIKSAMKSDKVINIVTESDLPVKHTVKGKLTWKFKSVGTPDFTFSASKHHLWDASSLEVQTGRRVLISAVYPPSSKHFSSVAEIARKSIAKLSFECPGVPYPWPQMTVFNSMEGSGGMESPMMVNSGDQGTLEWASEVTFHEISHSYLPFITGCNERRFSWMDEGWATYKGIEWSDAAPGTGKAKFDGVYQAISGTSGDIPLMVPSYQIADPTSSTFYSYGRSAMAFMVIEDQIGREKMDLVWKTFVERWSGKHPLPWDLFAIIREVAGEDLNWLIKPWYYDFAYADLAIENVDTENSKVVIENRGGLPVPVYLKIEFEDGGPQEIYRSADIWKRVDRLELDINKGSVPKSITLGNKRLFDTNYSNNSWEN